MSNIRLPGKIAIVSALISQAFVTSPIFASSFQLAEVSPGATGSATAGVAASNNDVSTMLANPATLTTLMENQVYVGLTDIIPTASMANASAVHTVNIPGSPPSSISAPVQGKTTEGDITSWAVAPDAYFGYRVNENVVAGIGITSPFGLTTSYDRDSVVRFTAQDSQLLTININPAIGIRLNPQWAIGVGLQIQYAQAVFSNFNGPYTGIPALDALLAANFPTYARASGWGYGANFGVFYKPYPCTRLGVGYRSKIVQDLSGKGQQYVSPGPTVPAPSQDFLFNAQTSFFGSINMPAILNMSAQQDIQNWTLKASAQLNFWDSFRQLSINAPEAFGTNSTLEAHWKNAWLLALGADYRLNPCWTLRAGTAYDQTPTVNGFREPRIPDSDRYWLTAGATYKIDCHFSIDGAYEYVFARNPHVNTTLASGSSATSTVPLEVNQVRADYKGHVNIIAVAVRYSFC